MLFRAKADTKDDDNLPVKVKASNHHYWGSKLMFQMISSGSPKLEGCSHPRDSQWHSIKKGLECANVSSIKRNILQSMEVML